MKYKLKVPLLVHWCNISAGVGAGHWPPPRSSPSRSLPTLPIKKQLMSHLTQPDDITVLFMFGYLLNDCIFFPFFHSQVRHGSVQSTRVPRGQLVCCFIQSACFFIRPNVYFHASRSDVVFNYFRVSPLHQTFDQVACEGGFNDALPASGLRCTQPLSASSEVTAQAGVSTWGQMWQ